MTNTIPIPGPRPYPLIGNLLDIDINNTVQSFSRLAKEHGPIYKLRLGGSDRIFITGHEIADELLTRKDVAKHIMGVVGVIHEVVPHGLFTAHTHQESWGQVRRTLNPAFTPLAIRDMFPGGFDLNKP